VTIHPLFSPIADELTATLDYLQTMLPPEAPRLAEATDYSLATPGKMVRPAMVHALWNTLTGNPSDERVIKVAAITEMIHLATLLHDDVLDESDLRRGNPTVRQMFGNRIAILGGDWLLAKASQTLASLGDVKLVKLYADVLAHLCEGEVLQNDFAFKPLRELTWDAYASKTFKKTASLYATAMEAVTVLAQSDEAQTHAAVTFGSDFGMAFQYQDDLLDYTGEAAAMGKPVLDDIRNGLANAPILLVYQDEENRPELDIRIADLYARLEREENEQDIETQCLALQDHLKKIGAIEQTRQLIDRTIETARAALHQLPASQGRDLLRGLLELNASRKA